MGDLPPLRIRVRRERLVRPGPAVLGLGASALFILYGSSGRWASEVSRAAELPGLSLPDITQNVLLYVPVGIFGVWSLRGSRLSRAALWLSLMLLAFVYSACIELLQMLLADRFASPIDVIANVGGTAVGVALGAPTSRGWAIAAEHVRRTGLWSTPARYVLAAVLTTILVTAWYSFDITLDISTLSERTRAVRRDPWLWPAASAMWAQGARYFVLAAITVFCLRQLARLGSPRRACGHGADRIDR